MRIRLLRKVGVDREVVLTGRGNDSQTIEYLKSLPVGEQHVPSVVSDEATENDVYDVVGGTDRVAANGSSEEGRKKSLYSGRNGLANIDILQVEEIRERSNAVDASRSESETILCNDSTPQAMRARVEKFNATS